METKLKRILESAWGFEGVLGRLRRRELDLVSLEKLREEIATIPDTTSLTKREVSLLWYAPLFLLWKREDLEERTSRKQLDDFVLISNGILAEIERILGVP